MDQEELFHEDWRDALKHLCKALGGYDAVGAELWPTKTRKAAGAWLSDCLNAERSAKLDLDEVMAILRMGRDRGYHVGLYFLLDELGYTRPTPVDPKDTEAEIARQMEETFHRAEILLSRFDRIQQQRFVRQTARIRAVEP